MDIKIGDMVQTPTWITNSSKPDIKYLNEKARVTAASDHSVKLAISGDFWWNKDDIIRLDMVNLNVRFSDGWYKQMQYYTQYYRLEDIAKEINNTPVVIFDNTAVMSKYIVMIERVD